jgi:hypothetical protein
LDHRVAPDSVSGEEMANRQKESKGGFDAAVPFIPVFLFLSFVSFHILGRCNLQITFLQQ